MDLSGEASSGAHIYTARLVSVDKTVVEPNHAINSTLLCHSYNPHPDFGSYHSALHIYAWVVWAVGLAVLLAICSLYIITVRSAMRHWKDYISNVAVVLSIYPIVAAAAYLTILVPRARMLAEAIAQQAVMVALYHFFRLVIAECGGPDQLVRSADGAQLETRVLPCCCWPCCVIPRPVLRKETITWLNYLILQVPIIQAIIYVLIVVIWCEDFMLLQRVIIYFQPFVAASILSGMWGLIMSVIAATSVGYRPRPRLVAVQLVLIIVKLQWALAKALPDIANLPCLVPLHPSIFTNLIHNSVMMLEMLMISIWAWRLYSVPPGKVLDLKESRNKVLEGSMRSIEVRSIKDGIDNKSYSHNGNVEE